ncbi:MAG: hypothetical protein ACREM3_18520 [Candidatus Rokuibacteriota bacterium]
MGWYEIEIEYVTNRVFRLQAASLHEARQQIARGFLEGYERRHSTWLDVVYIGRVQEEKCSTPHISDNM